MKYTKWIHNSMKAEENGAWIEISYDGEILSQSKANPAFMIPEFPADKIDEAIEYIKSQKPAEPAKAADNTSRVEKERKYDEMYNEGCEGYNPYRQGSRPTYWKSRW